MGTEQDIKQADIKQAAIKQAANKNKKRKTAKSTPDTGTIALLEMIHDRVQKSKRADRYIVTSDDKWGVTDSEGNFIIPMKFSLIQTSNDSVFRVYGEGTGKLIGNWTYTAELKEQAVYDYDGKCLIPMGAYSKVLAMGKFGLAFGQSKQVNEFSEKIKILRYNGEVLDLADKNIRLNFSNYVPNIILANYIKTNGQAELEETFGIMVDNDKLEMKPIKECYNSIVTPRISGKSLMDGEITSDIELSEETLKRIRNNLSVMYASNRESKEYIVGKTNSGEVLLHTDYTPIINMNDKKAKIKSMFHGLMEE